MKELKHTIDLENYIVNDLKTDEDIKLYLNTSLKDSVRFYIEKSPVKTGFFELNNENKSH